MDPDFIARSEALLEATIQLSAATHTEGLVRATLETLRKVLQTEACSVSFPTGSEGDLLIWTTQSHLEASGEPLRIPAGKGIAGWVFLNREVVNLADVTLDGRHYPQIGERTATVPRTMLTVPLLWRDECLGVLQIINPGHAGGFDANDVRLATAFASLVAVCRRRLLDEEATREQDRLEQYRLAESDAARRVQQSLLPSARMECAGWLVRTRHRQAAEVGGDGYICVTNEDGRLLVGVVDISGKGMSAALGLARLITLLLGNVRRDRSVSQALEETNRLWRELGTGGLTASILLGEVTAAGGTVWNCAAPTPWARAANGAWSPMPAAPGAALGRSKFRAPCPATIPTGSAVLLFSDGISEAVRKDGSSFAEEHLADLLQRGPDPLGAVMQKWEAECANNPRRDDATLLLLTPTQTDWCGDATAESIGIARRQIDSWLGLLGTDEEQRYLTVLGVDELLTNLLKHALAHAHDRTIRLRAAVQHTTVRFSIDHHGKGITDLAVRARDPSPRRFGGRGLPLIADLFSELEFTQTEDGWSRITASRSLCFSAEG